MIPCMIESLCLNVSVLIFLKWETSLQTKSLSNRTSQDLETIHSSPLALGVFSTACAALCVVVFDVYSVSFR